MSLLVKYHAAKISSMALAKVGNPTRNETLKTSKELCRVGERDSEVLTFAFLKPFKNLERQHFHHHSDVSQNEIHRSVTAVFKQPAALLDSGRQIARHLFSKSNHPNIKSGDLCVSIVEDVMVEGIKHQAICIIKSESRVPFLEISDQDGDLKLTTHNGIYPEKIDKGCLIIDRDAEDGYLVYTFDKSSGESQFWVRDFLALRPKKDAAFMTKQYAEMCVSFAEEGLPEDMAQEEKFQVANKALAYFDEKDEFDEGAFKQEALTEPAIIEKFNEYKSNFVDEDGKPIDNQFPIEKKAAKKASSKLKSLLKLDTGVTLRFTPNFVDEAEKCFERGMDEEKGMKFIKIYYNEEI